MNITHYEPNRCSVTWRNPALAEVVRMAGLSIGRAREIKRNLDTAFLPGAQIDDESIGEAEIDWRIT